MKLSHLDVIHIMRFLFRYETVIECFGAKGGIRQRSNTIKRYISSIKRS